MASDNDYWHDGATRDSSFGNGGDDRLGRHEPSPKEDNLAAADKEEDDVEMAIANANVFGGANEQHPLGGDLKMVLPVSEINAEHPPRCSGDGCNLVACTIWSLNHDPETPWYSCLDCQEEDFGGWPTPESGDLPLRVLEDGLRNAMVARCTSGREEPSLPDLPNAEGGIPPWLEARMRQTVSCSQIKYLWPLQMSSSLPSSFFSCLNPQI